MIETSHFIAFALMLTAASVFGADAPKVSTTTAKSPAYGKAATPPAAKKPSAAATTAAPRAATAPATAPAKPEAKKPEAPKAPEAERLTDTDLKKSFGDAVKSYIDKQAAASGGAYTLTAPDGKALKLELVRVHKHKIEIHDETYSALADFKGDGMTRARVRFTATKDMQDEFTILSATLDSLNGKAIK